MVFIIHIRVFTLFKGLLNLYIILKGIYFKLVFASIGVHE